MILTFIGKQPCTYSANRSLPIPLFGSGDFALVHGCSKAKCRSGYYYFGCCTVAAQSQQSKRWGSLVLGYLQELSEWAMLGSNQRPLPCEGSALPLS
jgi:hypothetical protein